MYTGEISTHTWYLAAPRDRRRAGTTRWSPALAAVHRRLSARRGPGIPFAAPVAVPDDSPAIERLVAWQGRDPQWRPGA